MESLKPIEAGLWRWDGVEQDHGFPIVGYIVEVTEGVVLIDPPHSATPEAIRACGDPLAIVVTSSWHVRGTPKWAEVLQIPIAAPSAARGALQEAGLTPEIELRAGQKRYGWEVIPLSAPEANGYAFEELALWHAGSRTLIVADIIVSGEDGTVGLGPNLFAQVPVQSLKAALQRIAHLQPRLLLSAHLGPRQDGAEILTTLLRDIES